MSSSITIEGDLEKLLGGLRADLPAELRPVTLAYAVEVHAVVSPYPVSRGRGGRTWYERGYGTRWRRKDGSIGGRKSSENLGRRWSVKPTANGAEITNTASYAPRAHDTKKQAKLLGSRGWRTVATAINTVRASGRRDQLITEAVVRVITKGRSS